jgi:radical SAM family uncharacterized protein
MISFLRGSFAMQSPHIVDFHTLERYLPTVEKPSRYLGGEFNQPEICTEDSLRVALGFPDVYEIGMSHLGLRILYHLLNEPEYSPGTACERVFAPWTDMAGLMAQHQIPLHTLETHTRIKDMDVLGFSVPYEMLYSNVLEMLEQAGIPLLASERGEDDPLVIIGGAATFNSEPIADFIDGVFLGEAEESLVEFCEALFPLRRWGGRPATRAERLAAVDGIEGVYFPRLACFDYQGERGPAIDWSYRGQPRAQAEKRIVSDLEYAYFPVRPILPHIGIVHDRANVELHRGCLHGCRYCQAGMTTRPHRQRSPERLRLQAREILANTGYEELGLASLNSVDYPNLKGLILDLNQQFKGRHVALGLPSLRVDRMSVEVADALQQVKRTHLTLAPESGSRRLRDVINKSITDEDILGAVQAAIDCGWSDLKLYFMVGLPTETDEDMIESAALLERIAALTDGRPGKKLTVTASFSPFVPQSHTPFQWCGVTDFEIMQERVRILRRHVRNRRIKIKWRDLRLAEVETVFARGDRRLGKVLLEARKRGQHFDGWSEHFNYQGWMECFEAAGIDPYWYIYRDRERHEVFPWDVTSTGVSREFLWRDWLRAQKEQLVPNCFLGDKCITCGIQSIAC